jgi:hypothetical protein
MGEETSTIGRGPCPCRKGRAVAYHTTPDHGWASQGWTSYGLECDECEKIYAVYCSTIYRKDEWRALEIAKEVHDASSTRLYAFISPLVDKYFENFASKPMTHQLAEMVRLDIQTMTINHYRRERNIGKLFSSMTRAMRNPEWVRSLVKEVDSRPDYELLENDFFQTSDATKILEKEITSIRISELRPW